MQTIIPGMFEELIVKMQLIGLIFFKGISGTLSVLLYF